MNKLIDIIKITHLGIYTNLSMNYQLTYLNTIKLERRHSKAQLPFK